MRLKVTDQVKIKIFYDFKNGLNKKEIAKNLSLSPSTVRQVLRMGGLDKPRVRVLAAKSNEYWAMR